MVAPLLLVVVVRCPSSLSRPTDAGSALVTADVPKICLVASSWPNNGAPIPTELLKFWLPKALLTIQFEVYLIHFLGVFD